MTDPTQALQALQRARLLEIMSKLTLYAWDDYEGGLWVYKSADVERVVASLLQRSEKKELQDDHTRVEPSSALPSQGSTASGNGEQSSMPSGPEKAWILSERWRDGSDHIEGIALSSEVGTRWVRGNDEMGHARTSMPYKIIPPPLSTPEPSPSPKNIMKDITGREVVNIGDGLVQGYKCPTCGLIYSFDQNTCPTCRPSTFEPSPSQPSGPELESLRRAFEEIGSYLNHRIGCTRINLNGPCICGLSRFFDDGTPLSNLMQPTSEPHISSLPRQEEG